MRCMPVARGRLISRTLGSSRKFHRLIEHGGKLGEFSQCLFQLIIANTDDFGKLSGDAFTVKHLVLPSSKRPESDFDTALDLMDNVGLIERYAVDSVRYLRVCQFEVHQVNLHKRTSSLYPDPLPNDGISRNFPEHPEQEKRIEGNGTELKRMESNGTEGALALVARNDAFERFWSAYPKKKAKDEALKAWTKRKPDAALVETIMSAVHAQSLSDDWRKDGGQFIPHPATWLNRGQWDDAVHVPVASTIPTNKRIAGLMAGGEKFLAMHREREERGTLA